MTRTAVIYLVCAVALSAAVGAVGFPRPAIAGLVTFSALLGCGTPRNGLLAQITLSLGLITATAPGVS